jgi:hypothetical protein
MAEEHRVPATTVAKANIKLSITAGREDICNDRHAPPSLTTKCQSTLLFFSYFLSQESDRTMMLSGENRGRGLIRANTARDLAGGIADFRDHSGKRSNW